MTEKLENLSTAIRLVIVGIIIFSIIYPLTIGVFGQIWSNSAKGSLMQYDNETIGSELIGQNFENSVFFHSRPSSINYESLMSGSKNLSPQNPALENRVENILESSQIENEKIPSTLVTESGSALDPHITVRAAMVQVPRISSNSGISEAYLRSLVEDKAKEPLFGIYGLRRVNVLKLNKEIKGVLEGDNLGE